MTTYCLTKSSSSVLVNLFANDQFSRLLMYYVLSYQIPMSVYYTLKEENKTKQKPQLACFNECSVAI